MTRTYSIARAGFVVMVLNGVAIVAAFVREATIAYYYGASAELDSFLVAISIPRFVGEAIVVASTTALIPVFAKIRAKDGDAKLLEKVSNLAVLNLLGLSLFTGVYVFVSPFAIRALAPGFEAYRHDLAVRLTILLAPITVLWGSLGILKAVQNSFRRFALPELSRSLLSAGVAVALVLLASRYGVYAMVTGFIGGLALAVVLNTLPILSVRRILKLRFALRAPEVRDYIKMVVPVLATGSIYFLSTLVSYIFASTLSEGDISLLRYAAAIMSVPISLIGGAVTTVSYPELAHLWSFEEKDRFNSVVARVFKVTFFVGFLISVSLIVHAKPVVQLIYQRGKFTSSQTDVCSTVLSLYAPHITFSIALGVFLRIFFSTRWKMGALILMLAYTGTNVIFNMLLVPRLGIYGMPLALTFAGVIAVITGFILYKERHKVNGLLSVRVILFYCLISVFAGAVSYLLYLPDIDIMFSFIGGIAAQMMIFALLSYIMVPDMWQEIRAVFNATLDIGRRKK